MAVIEKFGQFEIALGSDGRPIELPRSPDEVVFLAFDARVRRIVELHVLQSCATLRDGEKRATLARVKAARETANGSFMRVLECGEDAGVPFYSTTLCDGEHLDEFILRRGALPAATVFSLMLPLLDDLITLQKEPSVLAAVCLTDLQIDLLEDTFLHLRCLDFGFASQTASTVPAEFGGRIVHECCAALFLMLTGKESAGEDCDRYPAMTGLPTGLRSTVRSSLSAPENAPTSLERLRDDIREALSAMTRDLGQRAVRRHLVAVESMIPHSSLRQILLHNIPLEQILKGRFLVEDAGAQTRYPFTVMASDSRTDAPVTVHLLPPKRIVAAGHYDAVPLQMWRFNAEKHPNILRSLSVWESPDMTFLTEERGTGFPLSRLIANRVYLNPPEVLILMRQVRRGIEQALDCGVDKLDLHPSNIVLRLAGQPQARELEKLMQKRLDAWPKFQVMLRPHMTMRSLYEPLLLDVSADEEVDEDLAAKDFRNRSYVALAAYLLSGKKQTLRPVTFPDTVPTDLAVYVQETLNRTRDAGAAPGVAEFLGELEKRTTISEVESEDGGIALPPRTLTSRPALVTGPMESAGAVSDFEEDFIDDEPEPVRPAINKTSLKKSVLDVSRFKSRKEAPKGSVAVWLWAAGVALLVLLLGNLLLGGKSDKLPPKPESPLPSAQQEKPKQPASKPVEIRKAQLVSEKEREELLKHLKDNPPPGAEPEPAMASSLKGNEVAQP